MSTRTNEDRYRYIKKQAEVVGELLESFAKPEKLGAHPEPFQSKYSETLNSRKTICKDRLQTLELMTADTERDEQVYKSTLVASAQLFTNMRKACRRDHHAYFTKKKIYSLKKAQVAR